MQKNVCKFQERLKTVITTHKNETSSAKNSSLHKCILNEFNQ